MVVDLQPRLLTQLVRRMLAERGVTTIDPDAAAGEHVDVALVGGAPPSGLRAEFTVRLPGAGWDLPAQAVVEAAEPAQSRVADVADLDELIDLLMTLAFG